MSALSPPQQPKRSSNSTRGLGGKKGLSKQDLIGRQQGRGLRSSSYISASVLKGSQPYEPKFLVAPSNSSHGPNPSQTPRASVSMGISNHSSRRGLRGSTRTSCSSMGAAEMIRRVSNNSVAMSGSSGHSGHSNHSSESDNTEPYIRIAHNHHAISTISGLSDSQASFFYDDSEELQGSFRGMDDDMSGRSFMDCSGRSGMDMSGRSALEIPSMDRGSSDRYGYEMKLPRIPAERATSPAPDQSPTRSPTRPSYNSLMESYMLSTNNPRSPDPSSVSRYVATNQEIAVPPLVTSPHTRRNTSPPPPLSCYGRNEAVSPRSHAASSDRPRQPAPYARSRTEPVQYGKDTSATPPASSSPASPYGRSQTGPVQYGKDTSSAPGAHYATGPVQHGKDASSGKDTSSALGAHQARYKPTDKPAPYGRSQTDSGPQGKDTSSAPGAHYESGPVQHGKDASSGKNPSPAPGAHHARYEPTDKPAPYGRSRTDSGPYGRDTLSAPGAHYGTGPVQHGKDTSSGKDTLSASGAQYAHYEPIDKPAPYGRSRTESGLYGLPKDSSSYRTEPQPTTSQKTRYQRAKTDCTDSRRSSRPEPTISSRADETINYARSESESSYDAPNSRRGGSSTNAAPPCTSSGRRRFEDVALEAQFVDGNERPEQEYEMEISPGVYMLFRGPQETWRAVELGNTLESFCLECGLELVSVNDCQCIVCSECKMVNPVFEHPPGIRPDAVHGAGIGLQKDLVISRNAGAYY